MRTYQVTMIVYVNDSDFKDERDPTDSIDMANLLERKAKDQGVSSWILSCIEDIEETGGAQ